MTFGGPFRRWLLPAALLLAASAPSLARGELQAGPTLLEIGPSASATRLRLRNTGDAPVAAQVRIYAWSQDDGEDRLTASGEVVASPPIAQLPAGGEHVVRIVRIAPAATNRDRSFRVVVDELPNAQDGGDSRITLRMRYVVPVFVRAAGATPPALTCALENAGAQLACENAGGRPGQLGASRLIDGQGRSLSLSEGLFGYVLPGSRRTWSLPAGGGALDVRTLRLETRLDGQPTAILLERAH